MSQYQKNQTQEIKFEIVEHIGILSAPKSGYQMELNYVSWNNREPKFDIRAWDETHQKMNKGITLTEEELKNLSILIQTINNKL